MFIKTSTVADALEQGNIAPLDEVGVEYAVSPDYRCVLYIMFQKAWYVEGQGWRSMNAPPSNEKEGREKLWAVYLPNSSKVRACSFQLFIPLSEKIHKLSSAAGGVEIQTSKRLGLLSSDRLSELYWSSVTGHAEPEGEIEEKFERLFG